MLSRLLAIINKELIHIRRDPRTLAIALAMPAMQLILFGYAVNTVTDHVAMVVVDEASDARSRDLVATFRNSGYFDVLAFAPSRAEALGWIDLGDAKVVLVVPPTFGDDLLRGEPAEVQLVVDGSDPNIAQTALFAGGMVAQVHGGQGAARVLAVNGGSAGSGALDLRPVVLYNPTMQSANFMVPGLIGLILQFQTLILTSFAIVRERERGTLEQIVVTPIRPWELMLGKIIPYVGIAFLAVGVALGVGRLGFGVEVNGSLLLLLVLCGLFLVGSLGVGLLISTVSQTQAQAMQLAVFVMLPSVLLSGFMFSRDSMPWLIQQLGLVIPLAYFLQILRGIVLKGVGLEVLWRQVIPLAVFGAAVFTLSATRFQKRLG